MQEKRAALSIYNLYPSSSSSSESYCTRGCRDYHQYMHTQVVAVIVAVHCVYVPFRLSVLVQMGELGLGARDEAVHVR